MFCPRTPSENPDEKAHTLACNSPDKELAAMCLGKRRDPRALTEPSGNPFDNPPDRSGFHSLCFLGAELESPADRYSLAYLLRIVGTFLSRLISIQMILWRTLRDVRFLQFGCLSKIEGQPTGSAIRRFKLVLTLLICSSF